jgi:hypothetical protein
MLSACNKLKTQLLVLSHIFFFIYKHSDYAELSVLHSEFKVIRIYIHRKYRDKLIINSTVIIFIVISSLSTDVHVFANLLFFVTSPPSVLIHLN